MRSTVIADPLEGSRARATLIAGAVEALGSPAFLPALLASLNSLDEFPFLFAGRSFGKNSDFAPCVGHGRMSFETPAVLPLRTMDLDDPMLPVMRGALSRAPRGAAFVGCVSSQEIRNAQRREQIFERNGLAARVGMSAMAADGTRYFLCLYRSIGTGEMSDAYLNELGGTALVALSLLRKHWQVQELTRSALTPGPLQECSSLTDRERQVCSALLRGRTLPQLAATLGIRTTTARTYQQRAFARLGVRNRRELFALVHPNTDD